MTTDEVRPDNGARRARAPKTKLADLRTPLLYDFWYVAGYREDFTRDLRERTFLNRSVVTYRT